MLANLQLLATTEVRLFPVGDCWPPLNWCSRWEIVAPRGRGCSRWSKMIGCALGCVGYRLTNSFAAAIPLPRARLHYPAQGPISNRGVQNVPAEPDQQHGGGEDIPARGPISNRWFGWVWSGWVWSGWIWPGRAGLGLVGSGLAGFGLAGFGLAGAGLPESGLAESGLAKFGLAESGLAGSGVMESLTVLANLQLLLIIIIMIFYFND